MSFNFPSRTKGVFRFFYIQTLRLEQPPVMGKKIGVFSPGSKKMNRSVFSLFEEKSKRVYFYRIFLYLIFGLACDHGNSFLCLEE